MKYGINTIDDFDYRSIATLLRLDLNCPYDREKNRFKDTERIEAAIPTIKELSDKGARLVLVSHQGGDLEYQNFISTELHSEVISDLLSKPVIFIDDICGPAARQSIRDLKKGQILLLDNVRYMAEEMTLFETKLKLSPKQQSKTIVVQKLLPYIDLYVCDAFAAAHRSQPSLVGFEEYLPSAMGRLFEKEYEVLSSIMTNSEHPNIFLLGGAKIEDAFLMMPKVLQDGIADNILVSGLLANLFLLADGIDLGEVSRQIICTKKLDEYLDPAKEILKKYGDRIIRPVDYAYIDNTRKEIDAESLPIDKAITDIGSKTINLFKKIIDGAKTVFFNGPVGVFEENLSELGTKALLSHIAASKSFSVIGGGDSISAINKYGLRSSFSYICTGGGAMVRFLSGEELPVVTALKKSTVKFKDNKI